VALQDPANELLVSAATVWEIAIKVGLGKLTLSSSFRDWMNRAITDLSLSILPVTVDYAGAQAALPWHHRDPFDRLLIAQALAAPSSTLARSRVSRTTWPLYAHTSGLAVTPATACRAPRICSGLMPKPSPAASFSRAGPSASSGWPRPLRPWYRRRMRSSSSGG